MERIRSLGRILKTYDALEQMRMAELERARSALSEVEGALTAERGLVQESLSAGREALAGGNRAEWLLTEVQQEYLGLRRPRLEVLREERAVQHGAAQAEFLESRARTEQMKQVVSDLREEADAEQARRLQAAMDDRFLMRRSWGRARVKRPSEKRGD